MAQNPKFTIQLLEKIGAPLAIAIESVTLKGDDTEEQAAKLMAQMLGQAVQISISLHASFNAVEEEAQADSTRLALAALAAPLIAEFYTQNEKVPEDQDIKRLAKSLESVVAFADNFSMAEEGKSRLTTIDHEAPLFDKTQANLVSIQSLSPVIMAVADFSFGQSETKLVQDIAQKLQEYAADIAAQADLKDKLSEFLVFKALANLYAQCHRKETQKLADSSADDNDSRADLSLDPVWKSFSTHISMVSALMGIAVEANAPVSNADKVEETAVMPEVVVPDTAIAAATPIASPAEAPAPAKTGGPMGFFKKPDDAAAEATEQAPATAAIETDTKTDDVPTAEAPKEETEEEGSGSSSSSSGGGPAAQSSGSPMGFFKKP